jgi:hypothetical protein
MNDRMEISWGIDEPDQPEEANHEGDGQHHWHGDDPDPAIDLMHAQLTSAHARIVALEEEVLQYKKKAEEAEQRRSMHERHLTDVQAAKVEQKKELEATVEEISRLRAELGKPGWKRLMGK